MGQSAAAPDGVWVLTRPKGHDAVEAPASEAGLVPAREAGEAEGAGEACVGLAWPKARATGWLRGSRQPRRRGRHRIAAEWLRRSHLLVG